MSGRAAIGIAVAAALVAAGCGNATTATESGPTARELVTVLVSGEDLGTGWTVLTPPEDYGSVGVVTDENRAMVPRLEFCDLATAASRKAASSLRWEAFTQFNRDTGDERHLVFVQEFLRSDTVAATTRTFDLLAAGARDCFGQRTEYPDGEVGSSEEFAAPKVGTASVGSRETVAEPGGRPASWDIRSVLARDGNVLLGVTLVEVATPDQPRVLTEELIARIVTGVADKAFGGH